MLSFLFPFFWGDSLGLLYIQDHRQTSARRHDILSTVVQQCPSNSATSFSVLELPSKPGRNYY